MHEGIGSEAGVAEDREEDGRRAVVQKVWKDINDRKWDESVHKNGKEARVKRKREG